MAERLSLTPRYTASDAASAWRLSLEPEYVDTREALADLADIDAMLAAVLSGGSARSRQLERCRWAVFLPDGRLRVTLRLYVWPSAPEIPYGLSAPAGVEIGPRTAATRPIARKFWISGAVLLDLPWLLRDPRVSWVPGLSCFDGASREVVAPAVRYVAAGARVAIGGRCHGLLSVSGLAWGYVHDVAITYDKIEIDESDSRPQINQITAEDVEVSCLWADESGTERTETARLAIPSCVKTLLARCRTSAQVIYRINPVQPTDVVVYYNTCNGRVLRIRREPSTEEGAT